MFGAVLIHCSVAGPLKCKTDSEAANQLATETPGEVLESTTSNDENESETTNGMPIASNEPYAPSGWRPHGRLVVLPLEVRDESQATTEASNDEFTTVAAKSDSNEHVNVKTNARFEQSPRETVTEEQQNDEVTTKIPLATTPRQYYPQLRVQSSGRLILVPTEQEEIPQGGRAIPSPAVSTAQMSESDDGEAEQLETSEPKAVTTNGKLISEQEEADEEPTTTDKDDCEPQNDANDEEEAKMVATSQRPSENLETSSEPEAESVNVEDENKEQRKKAAAQPKEQVPNAAFTPNAAPVILQFPDGSYQRVVFLSAGPQIAQPTFAGQLIHPNSQQTLPFNQFASPRVVTFTSQYQAY